MCVSLSLFLQAGGKSFSQRRCQESEVGRARREKETDRQKAKWRIVSERASERMNERANIGRENSNYFAAANTNGSQSCTKTALPLLFAYFLSNSHSHSHKQQKRNQPTYSISERLKPLKNGIITARARIILTDLRACNATTW